MLKRNQFCVKRGNYSNLELVKVSALLPFDGKFSELADFGAGKTKPHQRGDRYRQKEDNFNARSTTYLASSLQPSYWQLIVELTGH